MKRSGFVIELFTQDTSQFTAHNRTRNEDAVQRLLNATVGVEVKGGLLLHQVGAYIQAKHCLECKFNGEEVQLSMEVFDLVGAVM